MQNSSYSFITPSSTCMSEDLLFFDTFSHSNSDKDNFDLVQFPSPVVIDLIKIVPLGQPVEAKIPGNVRLGATNPSNCELKFFINDLTKQDAHTMTDLGKFQCSEKETEFSPPLQIQTDGLLLRGSYRTLTLAIFGQIATYDEKPEEDQAITSAASPPAQTPASPVASEHDLPYMVRSVDQELLRRARDEEVESLGVGESTTRSEELQKDESLEDNADMNEDAILDLVEVSRHNTDNMEELTNSEGVPQAAFRFDEKRDNKDIEYSNSNSDLDNNSRRSIKDEHTQETIETIKVDKPPQQQQQQKTDDYLEYDAKEWNFNLDTYIPKPLAYFPDPSLTLQERTLLSNQIDSSKPTIDKEVEKVKEMFDILGCSNDSKTEEWVSLVEDLTNDISNMSLNQTVCDDDMLKFLVEQVLCGLDISTALKQRQTGYKVRHLRAGIKLTTILFHCGYKAVSVLLQAHVVQKVLFLYSQEQMSLPLRLLIFKCLSAACDTVTGVDHLISHRYTWDTEQLIAKIKEKFLNPKNLDDLKYVETLKGTSLTSYQYMLLILMSQPTTRITIAIGNLVKKIRFYQNLAQLAELSFPDEVANESEDSVFEDDHHWAQQKRDCLEKSLHVVQDLVSLMTNGCNDISQPIRYLPARTQFHMKPNSSDNYTSIYKWFKHFRTIECLNTILITTRAKNLEMDQSVKLQGYCLAFIQHIVNAPRSTQLLLSKDCLESTANLIRTLSEKVEQTRLSSHLRMSRIESLPDASFYREETLLAASCRDLSLKLCYNFKVFSCIDKLFDFHRKLIGKRSESASLMDPEKILHQLYIMSDHPYGLAAIMKHFSCIGNLDCILRFLDMPDYHKHLEFVRETSIDYVLELVGTFLRLNNNVIEIAEEYLDTLVELCKTKNKNLSVRIKSLLPWLNPFDLAQPFPLITYTEETLRQLTRVIRRSIPGCSIPFAQGLNFELPPQMITAVRILRQLCLPPQVESYIESTFDVFSANKLIIPSYTRSSTFLPFVDSLPHQQNHNQSWNLYPQMIQTNLDETTADQLNQLSNLSKLFQPYEESICGDLKYHYATMQVFEHDGLKRLLNTLRELVGNYPKPIYQSAALGGLRGRIMISYIHSVITLLHSITCHLIDARGKEFKDTSIIPVVLETYSLLCFVPKPDSDKIRELMKKDDLSALQKSITLRSDNYQLAQQAKKLILSILLSYTQMCLSVSESEKNVISKSMWTKMLQEVVDFTLSTPVSFHHGLDILTKILPAPLPCTSVSDTTDQEQLFKNINHRKLWSAHLHPLHQKIEQVISSLSLCCQSNIRILLCYLCNQLCDLSSNAACMVAKIITDTLMSCATKLPLDSAANDAHHQSSSDHNSSSTQQQQQQSTRQSEDRSGAYLVLNGPKESKFAAKMILNLLSNLITNQAFEIALTNHLQTLNKKDEKLLANLQNIIKVNQSDFSRTTNESNDSQAVNSNGNSSSTITSLIESIKLITESGVSKDNLANILPAEINPPDELTKINLIELARKTSDRFNLTTGMSKTYRLKVLLDINSRAHRSNEPTAASANVANNPSSSKRFERLGPPYSNYPNDQLSLLSSPAVQKSYVPPLPPGPSRGARGSGSRSSSSRPDSFRSRPQNTSRPPSIHVDDFVDIYRDNTTASNTQSRYPGGSKALGDYRNHHPSRGAPHLDHGANSGMDSNRHSLFFGSQTSSPGHHQGQLPPPYGSGRSHHGKGKYMKMK